MRCTTVSLVVCVDEDEADEMAALNWSATLPPATVVRVTLSRLTSSERLSCRNTDMAR